MRFEISNTPIIMSQPWTSVALINYGREACSWGAQSFAPASRLRDAEVEINRRGTHLASGRSPLFHVVGISNSSRFWQRKWNQGIRAGTIDLLRGAGGAVTERKSKRSQSAMSDVPLTLLRTSRNPASAANTLIQTIG
jgi:hypothetical protein